MKHVHIKLKQRLKASIFCPLNYRLDSKVERHLNLKHAGSQFKIHGVYLFFFLCIRIVRAPRSKRFVKPQSQAYSCYLQVSFPFLPFSSPSPCHWLSLSKSSCSVYPGSCRRDVSPPCDASHIRRQDRHLLFTHAASTRLLLRMQTQICTQTHTHMCKEPYGLII